MPYYTKPKKELHNFVVKVMKKYHPILSDHKVTIGLLAAWPTEREEENEESPLKLHGYACAATVKITSYKNRVLGIEDAIITLDGKFWESSNTKQQEALIDHELCHLFPSFGKEGELRRDDCGRPRLKMKMHDFQVGGFIEIVERHGDFAIEKRELEKAAMRIQLTLPFEAA